MGRGVVSSRVTLLLRSAEIFVVCCSSPSRHSALKNLSNMTMAVEPALGLGGQGVDFGMSEGGECR